MAIVDERRPPEVEEEPKTRVASLAAFLSAHRVLLRRLGIGFSLLILSVSIFIFGRTLISVDPASFKAAFAATRADQIEMAFGLAALSYLALTGYDSLALRHLGAKVPYRLTALASFTSYAISFTLGFSLVTGGAVRFWLYGPAGLSAGKVASLTVIAGITFWLGMGLVLGIGFLGDAPAMAEITHLAIWANRAIGFALFGGADRLSRHRVRHASSGQGGLPQFQVARSAADAGPDRARRDRCERGGRGALCPAAPGRQHRVCAVLRALLAGGDAGHRKPRAGRSGRVRGDDAQGG